MRNASVAARAAAAAAVTAAAGALTLLGLVHLERSAVEVGAVERLHGARRIGIRHLDEAETARTAGVTVRDQRDLLDRPMLREKSMDGLFGRREGEISDI